jgi:hypothetical protein
MMVACSPTRPYNLVRNKTRCKDPSLQSEELDESVQRDGEPVVVGAKRDGSLWELLMMKGKSWFKFCGKSAAVVIKGLAGR